MEGITVAALRAALDGVPDEAEVEVESNNLFGGWAGAESAYLTTKRIGLATDSPRTVPVFRITGGEHSHSGGPPGGFGD